MQTITLRLLCAALLAACLPRSAAAQSPFPALKAAGNDSAGQQTQEFLWFLRIDSSATTPPTSVYSISNRYGEVGPWYPQCFTDFVGKVYPGTEVKFGLKYDPLYTSRPRFVAFQCSVDSGGAGGFAPKFTINPNEPLSTPPFLEDTFTHTFLVANLPRDRGNAYWQYAKYQDTTHAQPIAGFYQYLEAHMTVLPRIERTWIEAAPICAADWVGSNQDYHFKVKTFPALSDVMFHSSTYVMGTDNNNDGFCDAGERHRISSVASSSYVVVNGVQGVSDLRGSTWNDTLPPFNQAQIEDRWISAATLQQYVDPNGIYYGQPIVIQYRVHDHYLFDSTITVVIPVITDAANTGSYHAFDYEVSGHEVWTPQNNPFAALPTNTPGGPTVRLQGKLTILPGASLRIENLNVMFGPDGYYEVQASPTPSSTPGGSLTLDSARLRGFSSYCDPVPTFTMWKGGAVWGCSTCPQNLSAGAVQGRITLLPGSGIFDAQDAIRVWKPGAPLTHTGGIVQATGASFHNNSRTVEFIKYQNFFPGANPTPLGNASRFTNCVFSVNKALSPYPFRGHVSGWEVKGVSFRGCQFRNLEVVGGQYTRKGYGIYGHDFGFTVDCFNAGLALPGTCNVPSDFYNLVQGIQVVSVTAPAAVGVNGATFHNNLDGVRLEGVAAPSVTGNTFSVPGTNSLAQQYGLYAHGVHIRTGSGYTVSGNTFGGLSTTGSVGAVVRATGSDDNTIQRNNYAGLRVGNLSNFQNRHPNSAIGTGLQFICNTYGSTRFDQSARGNSVSVDGIRANQGSATLAAGNTFNGGTGNQVNLHNPSSEVAPITYYYSGNVPSFLGNVNPLVGGQNQCAAPSDYPTWNPGKGFNFPPPTAGLRRVPQPLFYYLADETGMASRDSAYYWAAQWGSPYGDLLRTDMLIEDNRLGEVDALYNGIVGERSLTGPEAAEFSVWGRRLITVAKTLRADGKNSRELSAAQVDTLETVADSATMWARVRAQNWLSLYDGRTFSDPVLYPLEDGGPFRMMQERSETAQNVEVYPNPVRDVLTVGYDGEQMATLEVTDVQGRRVLRTEVAYGRTLVDVHHLVAGVYLWRIADAAGEKAKGKFVKQ